MAYGLEVYDALGITMLEVSSRLTRLEGVFSLSMPQWTSSVDVYINEILPDGHWGAIIVGPEGATARITIESGYVHVWHYEYTETSLYPTLLVFRI